MPSLQNAIFSSVNIWLHSLRENYPLDDNQLPSVWLATKRRVNNTDNFAIGPKGW